MSIETVLAQLIIEEDNSNNTLIFGLASNAREYFEKELTSSSGTMSSVRAMVNSRTSIKVLFLSKLQYLFMYLTKLEVDDANTSTRYTSMIFYGLDELLKCDKQSLCAQQVRLANLIFNVTFKLKNKHELEVQFVPSLPYECSDLNRLEQYWREMTSH
ncbi:LAFE_0H13696g1_1 [Lachancea fermentati]|uniref:LAFE_0H13696g1_1 n=1 Tax=Lachancea fermentati TaxID=4955 RepID=A0A1G4MKZ4_LACFM|nr:LAFE_0H13696g1_1 [Lachancea fermentati]